MGIIENMKDVADLVKQVGDIELNRKIVNLEKEVHELTRAKMRLETQLHETHDLLRKREQLRFKEPFYYADGDEIPYCPACWDDKTKAVHLAFSHTHTNGSKYWDCPVCKHRFHDQTEIRVASEVPRPASRPGRHGWMGS